MSFHYGKGGRFPPPRRSSYPMSAHIDFRSRHLGHDGSDRDQMLRETGYPSLADLIDTAVPAGIRMRGDLDLPAALSEHEALDSLKSIISKTACLNRLSAKDTTAHTRRESSSATSWKTPAGTRPTRPIRRRLPKADSKRYSTSKHWSPTSPVSMSPMPRCSTKAPPPPKR